jgi:hypothetical protein
MGRDEQRGQRGKRERRGSKEEITGKKDRKVSRWKERKSRKREGEFVCRLNKHEQALREETEPEQTWQRKSKLEQKIAHSFGRRLSFIFILAYDIFPMSLSARESTQRIFDGGADMVATLMWMILHGKRPHKMADEKWEMNT